MTTKEIRNAKPEGKMSKSYNDAPQIVFDNGVTFSFETGKERDKTWNKLKRMGFEQHYNFQSDEFDGLAEAGRIGENPFKYTIISK